MLLNKDGPILQLMYEGWLSNFRPFQLETAFTVSQAFDIDFNQYDFLVEVSYFPERFYRTKIPIDDIAGASDYYDFWYRIGLEAGKYFRSIELPLDDNIVLGEN